MSENTALTGAAGAYYIAFRLSALGYAVGLTTYGTRAIDILVANPSTGKSITVQTKTMRKTKRGSEGDQWWAWRVGKSMRPANKHFFYIFLDLKDDASQTPDVFIVPSIKLPPLLQKFKGGDTWCNINEEDAQEYQKWDIITGALG